MFGKQTIHIFAHGSEIKTGQRKGHLIRWETNSVKDRTHSFVSEHYYLLRLRVSSPGPEFSDYTLTILNYTFLGKVQIALSAINNTGPKNVYHLVTGDPVMLLTSFLIPHPQITTALPTKLMGKPIHLKG